MNNEYMKAKQIEDETPFIQVRKDTGTNYLHLQVYGTNMQHMNRDYGYADKFSVPPVVTQALSVHEGNLFPSLTTDSLVYFREMAEVHAYTDGVQLRLSVPSADWNAKDAFVLDLTALRFSQFIAFLEDNGLVTTHDGMRFVAPTPTGEEE